MLCSKAVSGLCCMCQLLALEHCDVNQQILESFYIQKKICEYRLALKYGHSCLQKQDDGGQNVKAEVSKTNITVSILYVQSVGVMWLFLCFSALHRSQGLVVFWFLLLHPSGLLSHFLQPHDLRDDPTRERKSEDLADRAPQAGDHQH